MDLSIIWKKSRVKSAIAIIATSTLIFWFGPPTIHWIKLNSTPESEIIKSRAFYQSLSNEKYNSHQAYLVAEAKRDSLYLWFATRGLQIDEGHEAKSKWQLWRELFGG